ncbi:FYVE finger-containing protein [Phaffia rhodozyma]|uniref:FYVE finger-containing protein n=1 Tax=Phaffia rhodozyma TaxID=264483 RepID=A0A0F7SX50_PHARH|nr:FYVE finger-containing protein [Phaffia rhodozyma]
MTIESTPPIHRHLSLPSTSTRPSITHTQSQALPSASSHTSTSSSSGTLTLQHPSPLRPKLPAAHHSVAPVLTTTRTLGGDPPKPIRKQFPSSSFSSPSTHGRPQKVGLPSSPSLNSLAPPGSSVKTSSHRSSTVASSSLPFVFPFGGSQGSSASSDAGLTPIPSPSINGPIINGTYRRSSYMGELSTGGDLNGQVLLTSKTPYRAGFQPKGVWRDRSGDYEAARLKREEGRRLEERRLGRRLEKLIALHFTPPSQPLSSSSAPSAPLSPAKSIASPPPTSRRSSFFLPDLDALKNPSGIWKNLKDRAMAPPPDMHLEGGIVVKSSEYIRIVEQSIVKWEADNTVKQCFICGTNFNLTTRKHHCRLCGRIPCSLPPTPPPLLAITPHGQGGRKETCSLLIVADHKTGQCEAVEEGFVGFLKISDEKAGDSVGGEEHKGEMKVTGVRTCRDCWSIVSRKQYMLNAARVPAFMRLYDTLRQIQSEILELLPTFYSLLNSSSSPTSSPLSPNSKSSPPSEIEIQLAAYRKTLLENFASYDILAKKLRNIPCEKGSAQEKLQVNIGIMAGGFLASEMGGLQKSLSKQKRQHKHSTSSVGSISSQKSILKGSSSDNGDASSFGSNQRGAAEIEMGLLLQPLLEQEAQLESFIAEAEGQRKFEDAASLKTSLEEIRAEIKRLVDSG